MPRQDGVPATGGRGDCGGPGGQAGQGAGGPGGPASTGAGRQLSIAWSSFIQFGAVLYSMEQFCTA